MEVPIKIEITNFSESNTVSLNGQNIIDDSFNSDLIIKYIGSKKSASTLNAWEILSTLIESDGYILDTVCEFGKVGSSCIMRKYPLYAQNSVDIPMSDCELIDGTKVFNGGTKLSELFISIFPKQKITITLSK
jgi:hypothetical protein